MPPRVGPLLFFERSKKRRVKKTAQGGSPLGILTWWTVGKLSCGWAAPVGAGGMFRPLGGWYSYRFAGRGALKPFMRCNVFGGFIIDYMADSSFVAK